MANYVTIILLAAKTEKKPKRQTSFFISPDRIIGVKRTLPLKNPIFYLFY